MPPKFNIVLNEEEVKKLQYDEVLRHLKELKEVLENVYTNENFAKALEQHTNVLKQVSTNLKNVKIEAPQVTLDAPQVNVQTNQEDVVGSVEQMKESVLYSLNQLNEALIILQKPREWKFTVTSRDYDGWIETVIGTQIS